MSKVFIFGIDGGSLKIIQNMVSEGKLPTFRKIMNNGTSSVLKSTIPPHTAPGWVSAVTGVGPGQHGIYQFWDTQGSNYIGKFMGSRDWKRAPLWNILNEVGLNTGIINVPMTHPPYPVDGYIITWPLSKTLRYSNPDNLMSEIAAQGGHYLPDISTMYHGEKDYLNKALSITEKRVQTIKYLLNSHEWDFMMTVFPEVDRISHFYWHFWDESSPEYCPNATKEEKEAITSIYEATDRAVADVLVDLPEDTLILIISDHGFGAGELNFNVQTFLKDSGFLFTRGIETDPEQLIQSGSWFSYTENGKGYTVDWTRTKAYMAAPGSYGVNINLKGRQKEGIVSRKEFDFVRTQIIDQLHTVKHPVTKSPLFKKILRSEEVYSGDSQNRAPDIILIPQDYGVMINHNLIPGQWFTSPEQKGMHRQEGIFLATGPTVKKNYKLNKAKLEDIVPTVLDYFGIPIPDYVEGEVLPIFYTKQTSYRKSNTGNKLFNEKPDPQESYSEEEQGEIEERLKSLGYL